MDRKNPRLDFFDRVLLIAVLVIVVVSTAVYATVQIYRNSVASRNAIMANLMSIQGAKNQWVLETGQSSNAVPTWDTIAPYLGNVSSFHEDGPDGEKGAGGFCLPKYPRGATYTIGRLGESPTCYFRGRTLILTNF
jgi:hypothetical protein